MSQSLTKACVNAGKKFITFKGKRCGRPKGKVVLLYKILLGLWGCAKTFEVVGCRVQSQPQCIMLIQMLFDSVDSDSLHEVELTVFTLAYKITLPPIIIKGIIFMAIFLFFFFIAIKIWAHTDGVPATRAPMRIWPQNFGYKL